MKRRAFQGVGAIAAAVLLMLGAVDVSAQGRMSDKDVENTMKNLKEDVKKFRSALNSSIGKSTIRKTSQEKDAKALAQRLEKQAEAMLNQFKSKKKADTAMQTVLATRDQLNTIMGSVTLDSKTTESWSRVVSELDMLAKGFNLDSAGVTR